MKTPVRLCPFRLPGECLHLKASALSTPRRRQRPPRIASLLLAALFTLMSTGLGATVYYVDGSVSSSGAGTTWGTAFMNVQEGINACTANGDEVWVKAGTYYPTLDPLGSASPSDNRDKTFYITAINIKLYGGFNGTETASSQRNAAVNLTTLSGDIDASGNNDCYHVLLTLGRSAACVVDGFTISGGKANGSGSFAISSGVDRNSGGGMYNLSSALSVSSCSINGNTASSIGGGMYNESSNPTIGNCSFTSNAASSNGGGMYNNQGSFTMGNCSFTSNSASSGGGGMYLFRANNTAISNCAFNSNTAGSGGGGGIIYDRSVANISACTFSSNTSSGSGGALVSGGTSGGGTVTNCIFAGNTATNGGAAQLHYPVTLQSCVFYSNTATANGGAIIVTNSGPTITNCTFNGNSSLAANGTGSAAYFTFSASGGTLTNCIVWGNYSTNNTSPGTADEIHHAAVNVPNVTYSIIRTYGGTGSINSKAHPSYVDATDGNGTDNIWRTADDGLALQAGSPAINAGDPSSTAPTADILGNPRVGAYDLGAYEQQNPVAIATGVVSGSPFCAGATITVPFTATSTYNSGNSFTVQLSDASGSWATPVSIGTLAATSPTSLTATIPSNTAGGSNYRVRVVASSPVSIGTDYRVDLTINPQPSIVPGANPVVCAGGTSARLSYSGATGSPDQYSLDFTAAANTAGFADVAYSTLPASPIAIAVPAGVAAGTYNATLKLKNSTTGCESSTYNISVTVNANSSSGNKTFVGGTGNWNDPAQLDAMRRAGCQFCCNY